MLRPSSIGVQLGFVEVVPHKACSLWLKQGSVLRFGYLAILLHF